MSSILISLVTLIAITTSQLCTGDCDPIGRTCYESGTCVFDCGLPASCTKAKFTCSKNATCSIICSMAAACNTVTIKAETAKIFTFISNANAAAAAVDIYCPNNGHGIHDRSCFLIAEDKYAGGQFAHVDIYAIEGFKDVLISNCTYFKCGSITMHGCGKTYTSNKCTISTIGYTHCKTEPNVCSEYLPTGEPTPEPTPQPTTSQPTLNPTYSPTIDPTLNPTTNVTKEWINIPYIVLSSIMIILCGLIIIMTIQKFFNNSEGLIIMKRIRIIALSQTCAFFLSYVTWLICIIILYRNGDNHSTFIYILFAGFQYLFWIIGWMLFYILSTYKLYDTFSESIYKMSSRFIYFHIFIILFIPGWYLCMFIYDELFNSTIYFVLSATGSVLISFGMLTLLISFNHNLFIVISNEKQLQLRNGNGINRSFSISNTGSTAESSCSSVNKSSKSSKLNKIQSSLLKIIVKQTLLTSTMLFGGIIFLCAIILISTLSDDKKTSPSAEWIIYEWFLGAVIIINLLCVYLGWNMNKKEYHFCCGKLHSILIRCCENCVDQHPNANNINDMFSKIPVHQIN